ncbi:RNA polymerase sigma factor [Ruicaihuangia caeni]|uniref:RNA polymerase sigma factor n=1 Tax=Ruicaihuangia caeni TaxID=3042517 RepID=A0AAW6T4I2_9MICO|nr:sigma-70 family RNA polymerase sigma factor [Klugiella sp. YN-L-19]MDI2098214.1 sigma-70 family RNA polymerase sigma factor [Klugiella sp. YN-L-19]
MDDGAPPPAHPPATARSIDAIWRIEGARIVAAIARVTGDLALAEDLAQDALIDAMTQWPSTGVPRNPAAWLTTVAKRKAIDTWRRQATLEGKYRTIAADLETLDDRAWEPIEDDLLRLIFVACHPVLARPVQVALTLRVVGGLTTEEIARLLLVQTSAVQQRIVRAKKTLAAARIPFETPEPADWPPRLRAVLAVIYLIFTEGYAPTSGDRWLRPELACEALRLGRMLASLAPREPETHALVALMEFQSSRFAARTAADGSPVLLADQDRSRWDRSAIARGSAALARSDALGRGRGYYELQAAIAECHATATTVDTTDWEQIALLYEALAELSRSPVVELNRAVAVSMAGDSARALQMVDRLASGSPLPASHLLPSVRGELLARLGRTREARAAFLAAASLTANSKERETLQRKAGALDE